jgi:hypothetical protein
LPSYAGPAPPRDLHSRKADLDLHSKTDDHESRNVKSDLEGKDGGLEFQRKRVGFDLEIRNGIQNKVVGLDPVGLGPLPEEEKAHFDRHDTERGALDLDGKTVNLDLAGKSGGEVAVAEHASAGYLNAGDGSRLILAKVSMTTADGVIQPYHSPRSMENKLASGGGGGGVDGGGGGLSARSSVVNGNSEKGLGTEGDVSKTTLSSDRDQHSPVVLRTTQKKTEQVSRGQGSDSPSPSERHSLPPVFVPPPPPSSPPPPPSSSSPPPDAQNGFGPESVLKVPAKRMPKAWKLSTASTQTPLPEEGDGPFSVFAKSLEEASMVNTGSDAADVNGGATAGPVSATAPAAVTAGGDDTDQTQSIKGPVGFGTHLQRVADMDVAESLMKLSDALGCMSEGEEDSGGNQNTGVVGSHATASKQVDVEAYPDSTSVLSAIAAADAARWSGDKAGKRMNSEEKESVSIAVGLKSEAKQCEGSKVDSVQGPNLKPPSLSIQVPTPTLTPAPRTPTTSSPPPMVGLGGAAAVLAARREMEEQEKAPRLLGPATPSNFIGVGMKHAQLAVWVITSNKSNTCILVF